MTCTVTWIKTTLADVNVAYVYGTVSSLREEVSHSV